jgi:aminoglycoside 2''-phosphotransferase
MDTDASRCRQILEAAFPQIPIHSLSVIQAGWDALVLVVNDRYIFRFPRRPEIEAQMEKEMDLLPGLAGALPCLVPRVEFACRKSAGDAHTLVGYPLIAGVGLQTLPVISAALVRQLGEFLTALHRFPVEQAALLLGASSDQMDWRRRSEETYTWINDLVFPHLPGPDRLAGALLWEVYLSDPGNFAFQPKLIHGDLEPEHILCKPDGSGLCGVIDWGDACIGDPALDFSGLFTFGRERLVDGVFTSYQEPLDETFRRRVRFYHTSAPFYEIRYALSIEDETLLRHGIEALSQRLRV